MTFVRSACLCASAVALLVLPPGRAQTAPSSQVDAAFARFWAAASPREAASRAAEVVNTGISFDEAWRRLRAGRQYGAQKAGVFFLSNRSEDGMEHNFAVDIPPGYDPARRYQVRFQLHGGIGRAPTTGRAAMARSARWRAPNRSTSSRTPGRKPRGGATIR